MKSRQKKRIIRKNKSKRHKVYKGGEIIPEDVNGFPSLFENGRMVSVEPAENTNSTSGISSTYITAGVIVVGAGALLTVLLMRR